MSASKKQPSLSEDLFILVVFPVSFFVISKRRGFVSFLFSPQVDLSHTTMMASVIIKVSDIRE